MAIPVVEALGVGSLRGQCQCRGRSLEGCTCTIMQAAMTYYSPTVQTSLLYDIWYGHRPLLKKCGNLGVGSLRA